MYFGETAINLDAKGRLAIPTRYREALEENCG
ncbi:MAG: cell division/cell wall cluster transcriptional repressor MraZ, partial [Xanthomonadales bacterium]|nr:cell division/cell wall cluster transcriptional repressor MraZ [Xanthomonadales bacterium]